MPNKTIDPIFGQRLHEQRYARSLSMDELSCLYNQRFQGRLNKSTISRYETAKQEPATTVVKNFAELFNVSYDYLSGRSNDLSLFGGFTRIPVFNRLIAGQSLKTGAHADSFDIVPVSDGVDFALVAGEKGMTGMDAHDGDLIYVRAQPSVENGEVALALLGNEAVVRRVFYYGNTIVLRSESSDIPEGIYKKSELSRIKIVGKVRFVKHEIR